MDSKGTQLRIYMYSCSPKLPNHPVCHITLSRDRSIIPNSHKVETNGMVVNWWLDKQNVVCSRQWHPTPVLLPGKSHGWRSQVGWSPWDWWELDTTERLHFHFSLSCIGEGNSNPLQCSCLENPRDGGAWWAAVYGVAQSQTRLKWLSSSSSNMQWNNIQQ